MSKLKVRSGDEVVVINGSDKGKRGRVIKTFPSEGLVLVSGVNIVSKHLKPTQQSEGKIIKKEKPVHVSNVSLIDVKENKASKVGRKFVDGVKIRFTKLSGESISSK